ncbi:5-methyltetrahydropteroyltriglutamate--homocysteine S-methyltransferase [Hyphomicrobium sulfonivorans]|uniref:5-methyltetrahydropteroyltriglutamate-- homocysteine S-methyltransferase n=1 Tax=Hyphomicrobium sulfonivorans TaxID=121290 RepID=UPI00156F12BC|nr:5-methyltetrahydropteroyltriglutamate--homocysteine S-methyltransferase [Hyphomicrobium sulfonivorans]MBI1650447.1 5-methyltetrahydropteroyltriglutamate--homocysteine S-methyltransferase [Hyphomicrobium sulfonivorans]NSL72193.1 5-methyltetrahydropteroyltriglutamate--homocysteine S-methyltransferase [Hyphomicrobium sulfonivorans]
MSVTVTNLGFPRIGPRRELKQALESYWAGKSDEKTLLESAAALRATNWTKQRAAGIDHIPSNDFSLYDHVLDICAMVGAIPSVYGPVQSKTSVDTYFAMARGSQEYGTVEHPYLSCGHQHGLGVPAMEMTKWFDTNYHYMVPELSSDQSFALTSPKPVDEFKEAQALGIKTRPVLLGPVTFLTMAKSKTEGFDTLKLLSALIPVYVEILRQLAEAGAEWVQIDEPCLATDLGDGVALALQTAYGRFAEAVPQLKLLLTSYFGAYGDNLDAALSLPVAGLHLDLARAPEQLETVLAKAPKSLTLSLGVIDGRNVWRANLPALLDKLEPVVAQRGADKIFIAPSCSMLHVPIDLDAETTLDPEVKNWMAFATQKLGELKTLGRALNEGRDSVKAELTESMRAAASRKSSQKIHNPAVAARMAAVTKEMASRKSPFAARQKAQRDRLQLVAYPTTTIGSFPQTPEVRKARAANAKGALGHAEYNDFLRKETEAAVRWQEEIGIDVLVHGEFERNDMVQYFGEQLDGFTFTKNGWVQSYGSRYVRPPIIFGDVTRPKPMTVEWWQYAQSLTKKPMKGMLTGPVTILNWSFVRDDIPRSETCRQIALAIRDEVTDLEKAGAAMIQIDEAALREGLPLRRSEWPHYLDWAVDAFRITASGVDDATQIHTHMCYSEFNDIIAAIGAMDADVISIETSRSKMELLDAFVDYRYPNEIGPGVYDIHSPRVPDVSEMVDLLQKARKHLSPDQIWVNPDCGLKTRKWDEVRPALVNMVAAAEQARAKLH